METITAKTDTVKVGDKEYNLNEVRDIMRDEEKRKNYNGPSKIHYLAMQLGIPFDDALDVLDALTRRDTLKRVQNNQKVLEIANDIAQRIR